MYHHPFGSDHAAVPRISDNTLPFGLGLGVLGSKLTPPSTTSSDPLASHDDMAHHPSSHRQPMSPESASGDMMLPESAASGIPRSASGGSGGGAGHPPPSLGMGGQLVAGLHNPTDRSMTSDMDGLGSPAPRTAMGSLGCDETAPSPGGMRDDPDNVILDDNVDDGKDNLAPTPTLLSKALTRNAVLLLQWRIAALTFILRRHRLENAAMEEEVGLSRTNETFGFDQTVMCDPEVVYLHLQIRNVTSAIETIKGKALWRVAIERYGNKISVSQRAHVSGFARERSS
ncbi:uncharacterized protein [Diadema antillarum]|uniref:uncharacterized protein n=1 Tax=Diadema antillarum TaxID=105358 RepID=UPI003A8A5C24